ncbi:MAG: tetratricopeptide repeat protein [Magnetococcales bacterium]|nr:tetratricopeptide repeat protein [Magnetococcales bacterium]
MTENRLEPEPQLTIDDAYKQALDHFNSGRYSQADQLCTAIIQDTPNHIDAINLLGIIGQKVNRHDIAIELFQRAINIDGGRAVLHYNLGISLYLQGQRDNSIRAFKTALALEPGNSQIAGYLNSIINSSDQNGETENRAGSEEKALNQAVSLHQSGHLDEAIDCYQTALNINPENISALSNMGFALRSKGRLDEAVISCRRAILIKPDFADAYSNLGSALKDQGKLDEAVASFEKAIEITPDSAIICYNLGSALKDQGKLDEAVASFEKAIEIKPDFAVAYSNLGNTLKEQGRLDEAVASFEKAIVIAPDSAVEYYNLGGVLKKQGRLEEAVASLKKAVAIKGDFAEAYANLGNTLKEQGRLDEAVASFEKAIAITPDSEVEYYNLGSVLIDLGKQNEAIASFEKAIAIKADFAEAYSNLGVAFQELGQLDKAVVNLQKAITIKADFAEAYANLGVALQFQGKLDEAVASYQKAIAIRPGFAQAHSNLLMAMQYGKFDQEQIYKESIRWNQQHAVPLEELISPHTNSANPNRLLKIGIVSGDLRCHSIAFFFEPFITYHDRKSFAFYCYSNNFSEDEVTTRLQSCSEGWRNITEWSDEKVVKAVRHDEIDILIDLSGHSANNRLLVFAQKPAPIQINWLGHANTTGLSAMDYRLTDPIADPPGVDEELYSERLMRLPQGLYCYRPPDTAPAVAPFSSNSGRGTIFGSFNNTSKLTVQTIKAWSTILKQISGSTLLLKYQALSCETTKGQFLELFERFGVAHEQIKMLPKIPTLEEHLSLYSQIDICLDPFPYNGATTTCEAMWMGVPLIVLRGDYHAARVGASLLTQVGMESLIAESESEYCKIAVDLAADKKRLTELHKSLRNRMINSPLCDQKGFAKSLETLLRSSWVEWCSRGA